MKRDGIILDVDGTLWDSTEIVARAWQRAVKEKGVKGAVISGDVLKGLFGKTMEVIGETLFPFLMPGDRERLMELCFVYEHEELCNDPCRICYPGVTEGIKRLSGVIPVCIVSNCQSGYIELFLEKTGLAPYVSDIECYGNTGKCKAENIRLVVQRNHFRTPVYVGDTQGDHDAARSAGTAFIHAAYGFGTVDECDAEIFSFEELEQMGIF